MSAAPRLSLTPVNAPATNTRPMSTLYCYDVGGAINKMYWLTLADLNRFDQLPKEPDGMGVEVTLYALRKVPGHTPALVQFQAWVRPASCGASCFCAAEMSQTPFIFQT